MHADFCHFIEANQLFSKKEKVLIAVSGGIDSVVLCHLMQENDFIFGIAHCNFKLRGKESDKDADFVKALAQDLKVPYFEIRFDTANIAKSRKQSIQIVARDLRYDWLEDIRKNHNFTYLATAHHANDSIETAIYNLSKGCGIRGMHGILPKKNKVIRPLLFADKDQILDFAHQNGHSHREDASNSTDKYARNRIRHHVIPQLQQINPSLEHTFQGNFQRFRAIEGIYDWAIEFWRTKIIDQQDHILRINCALFKDIPSLSSILYEILKPYGFNFDQVEQMLIASYKQSGKQFFSASHELLIDRSYWFLKQKQEKQVDEIIITEGQEIIHISEHQQLILKEIAAYSINFNLDKNTAYFDKDLLKRPLKLRKWREGDTFQPFGMMGKHKKVSDVFSNKKLSLFQKEQVWILESQEQIAWLVGIRSDERFKISTHTKKVMVAQLITN